MIGIMLKVLSQHLSALESTPISLESGQTLFLRDDAVQNVFLVVSGEVHLLRHQLDGASLILQRAVPGDILAEASLFSDHYHCDAIAVAKTHLNSFRVSSVRDLFSRSNEFAEVLAVYLAREVQNTRARAEILSLKTVSQRLKAWLAWNNDRLPPKGQRKTLAIEIGVSPEALYREIAKGRE